MYPMNQDEMPYLPSPPTETRIQSVKTIRKSTCKGIK